MTRGSWYIANQELGGKVVHRTPSIYEAARFVGISADELRGEVGKANGSDVYVGDHWIVYWLSSAASALAGP